MTPNAVTTQKCLQTTPNVLWGAKSFPRRTVALKQFLIFIITIFWSHYVARRILVSRPGIEPVAPVVEAWSLNRWTIGEGPEILNDFWTTNPAFHFSLDSANSVASPAQDSLLPTSLFIHLCWFYCCLMTCWVDLSLLLWVWSKRKSK